MTTAALSTFPASLDLASTLRIYLKEVKYEFLKLIRVRAFSLSVIGFPVMFYLLFGISMNRGASVDGFHLAKYLLATYSCFGLIGAALFGIGVGLSTERAQGWLEVKQASPMPPLAYLIAKAVTAIAFGLIIVSILVAIGVTAGHVKITPVQILQLMGVTAAGAVPFASMGLLLALLVPVSAAPAVVNLIYLPMSFASGLWIPLTLLPHWVASIAQFLPTYHLAQLDLAAVGYGQPWSTLAIHWVVLAGFTLVFLGVSGYVFKRASARA